MVGAGSAWPITRLIEGNRCRSARSTSSTFSCTSATLSAGSTRQWKLTISPPSAWRTRTSCTSPTKSTLSAISLNASRMAVTRSGVAARFIERLQRLDVGLHLHVRAELLAHGILEDAGDVVGGAQRERAVDLEVERDGQLSLDLVHGDVVNGERPVARDHHDPFEHG